jgi:hypothetical protein
MMTTEHPCIVLFIESADVDYETNFFSLTFSSLISLSIFRVAILYGHNYVPIETFIVSYFPFLFLEYEEFTDIIKHLRRAPT